MSDTSSIEAANQFVSGKDVTSQQLSTSARTVADGAKYARDAMTAMSGPARIVTPLPVPEASRLVDPATLPLLLVLPGLDGGFATAQRLARQYPDKFDVKALAIPKDSPENFGLLVSVVKEYLAFDAGQQTTPPGRPVYLIGLSFGGLLALAVAAEAGDLVDRIVLVNPATSYPVSIWPVVAQSFVLLDDDVYNNVLPYALMPVLSNPVRLVSNRLENKTLGWNSAGDVLEATQRVLAGFGRLPKMLPKATLENRLNILQEGTLFMESRWSKVNHRVLALLSENDTTLPSATEGNFLEANLFRCRTRVLEGRGHTPIFENSFDLMQVLEEEGFYVASRNLTSLGKAPTGRVRARFGVAGPIEQPTPRELEIEKDRQMYSTLERLVSPCFFSTLPDGRVVQGFEGVPTQGPVLFVGNHQSQAVDVAVVVTGLLEGTGRLPRGLTLPWVMGSLRLADSPKNMTFPEAAVAVARRRAAAANRRNRRQGLSLETFGAVKVSPQNIIRLLEAGEAAMVFPGGIREATKDSYEKYQLFWPERAEFVRIAARYNATVVPFSFVGIEDNFRTLIRSPDMYRALNGNPLTRQWINNTVEMLAPRAPGLSLPKDERGLPIDSMGTGLGVPTGLPGRALVLFGKPLPLDAAMQSDKAACEATYAEVKAGVAGGLRYLLDRRGEDKYTDILPRTLYQLINGRTPPTFTP